MPSGQSLVVYSVDLELVRLTPGTRPQVAAVLVQFHSPPIVIGGLSTYGLKALFFSARAVASRISAAATSGCLRTAEYLSIPSLTATVSTQGRTRLASAQTATPPAPSATGTPKDPASPAFRRVSPVASPFR